MPSWNIHIAHVERLERRGGLRELGVRDVNAFAFGSLVPDIFVGYMVRDLDHTINYCDTHMTEAVSIPVPDAHGFYQRFIAPYVATGGVNDVTLGTWAHLTADALYNARVREFNQAHGIPAGDETRVRKQHDFDVFGAKQGIHTYLEVTPALLEQAGQFEHYELGPAAVCATVAAANEQVAVSAAGPYPPDEPWLLLSEEFLDAAFDEVDAAIVAGLERYAAEVAAAGGNPSAPAPLRNMAEVKRLPVRMGPPPEVLLAEHPQAASVEYMLAHNK
jgi:hypothetical protein